MRKKKNYVRKRKLLMLSELILNRNIKQINLIYCLLAMPKLSRERRYWMMEYKQGWFENIWPRRHDIIYNEIWQREFRLTANVFDYVVNLVREQIQRRDTNFRKCVATEKGVAIAVWRLATGNSYRTISKVFGVGKSTIILIIREFNEEMVRLALNFIRFPRNGRETTIAIEKFHAYTGCVIPNVVGAANVFSVHGHKQHQWSKAKNQWSQAFYRFSGDVLVLYRTAVQGIR